MKTVSLAGVRKKRLRKGYTTGTCTAAASKAAVFMLLKQEIINEIEVELPRSDSVEENKCRTLQDKRQETARIEIIEQEIKDDYAKCAVVKDAGDDPDVTHGIKIYAIAKLVEKANNTNNSISGENKETEPNIIELSEFIYLRAGIGIGKVTKPGLSVAVGEPAINPIPRKMIKENVLSVIDTFLKKSSAEQCKLVKEIFEAKSIEITVLIPEGVEIAKKTFNERLGIVGGISILGTTGIVRPMSLASLRDSLLPQVDVAVAQGYKTLVLVPGNMGEKAAQKLLNIEKDAIIQTSNFIGDVLDRCVEKKVEKVLLVGHIGKLVKVAAGYFDTHSNATEDPVEIIKSIIRMISKDSAPLMYVAKVNTAEEAALGLLKLGHGKLLDQIAEKVSEKAENREKGALKVGTAITVLSGEVVATDRQGREIIGKLVNSKGIGE